SSSVSSASSVRRRSDSASLAVGARPFDAARLHACASALAATEIAWRTPRRATRDQDSGSGREIELDMDASEAPTVLSLVPSARERAPENVSEELAYLPRSRRTPSASGP